MWLIVRAGGKSNAVTRNSDRKNKRTRGMTILVQKPSGQTMHMAEATWERCRYSPRYARWRVVPPEAPTTEERDTGAKPYPARSPHPATGATFPVDLHISRIVKGIPRVFHHIWFGGPLPDRFAEYREGWRRLHQGWEFVLWNETNLPPLINWACFEDAPTFAQKADIARYEILYRHGGVYVDTDFECLKNITPLVSGLRAFSASENPSDMGTVSLGILGAVPKHPLFAQLIRDVPNHYDRGRPPNETTGPSLITRLAPYHSDFVVFGRELFYPIPYGTSHYAFPKADAFAVHHWCQSWVGK